MKVAALSLLTTIAAGQSAYDIAPQNYTKLFENEYVRVSRAVYRPGDKLKHHTHPQEPTVFVYLTDSGPIKFFHAAGAALTRGPVKAGAIRFTRGNAELHEVESYSETVAESIRIELLTEPVDLPMPDVRLAPDSANFDNGQIRIERMSCDAAIPCRIEGCPSVLVSIDAKTATWHSAPATYRPESAERIVTLYLKTGRKR